MLDVFKSEPNRPCIFDDFENLDTREAGLRSRLQMNYYWPQAYYQSYYYPKYYNPYYYMPTNQYVYKTQENATENKTTQNMKNSPK